MHGPFSIGRIGSQQDEKANCFLQRGHVKMGHLHQTGQNRRKNLVRYILKKKKTTAVKKAGVVLKKKF